MPARRGGENAPSDPRLVVPVGGVAALDRFLMSAPKSSPSQLTAKSIIAASPCAARLAPNLPPTSTMQSVVPDTLARIAAVRLLAFFEHELVGAQPERIARQLERDVIVAAELSLLEASR